MIHLLFKKSTFYQMRIISGLYKGRHIQTPKGTKTRPTSGRLRESLFNICQSEIAGAHFLDLFAGSGAVGLEALSRGAASATFVDESRESVRCMHANIAALGVENVSEVVVGDVFDMALRLAKKGRRYDLIYADPPYAVEKNGVLCSQRLLQLMDQLLEKGISLLCSHGVLFIEEAAKAQPTGADLKHLQLQHCRTLGSSVLQEWIVTNLKDIALI
jgi:16S rRNA (guanine966-N2)-methyltransferase